MHNPDDVAACLRVLARAAERPDDPALATVTAAVDKAYRAGKKRRKAERPGARHDHDRALVASARRYREEVPPVAAVAAEEPSGPGPRSWSWWVAAAPTCASASRPRWPNR